MTTTIYQSRIEPPSEESREWLRPLSSGNLTRMTEMVNHLLACNSAMTITHFWHYPHFTDANATGAQDEADTLRPATSTGFFANPNYISLNALAPGATIIDGMIVEQIVLPHTSPYCGSMQLTLRFQAHRFNLDPANSGLAGTLAAQLLGFPYRIQAQAGTDSNILYGVTELFDYIDNESASAYDPDNDSGTSITLDLGDGAGTQYFRSIPSSVFTDSEIRFRLKDSAGNILDPSNGSGWAVRLRHDGQGLPQDQGIRRGEFGDEFPVCEVSLTIPSVEPSSSSLSPRALSYGSKARTGEGLILEIGYIFARPLSLTVNEVPPLTFQTSNFTVPLLFPENFPTGLPTANQSTSAGIQEVYYYEGHIYIQFRLTANASNGVVFFPEPPTSSWPFTGMDLSASGISGNSDFNLNGCSSSQFEYKGNCYGDTASGELTRFGASLAGFTGTPVPGDSSRANDWTTQPASDTAFPNMGEMVLQKGGKVWHSALSNFPQQVVVVSSSQPFTIEGSARLPTGTERGFVRVPASSVSGWSNSLAAGDPKTMAAFTIYNSTLSQAAKIFHAQESDGGAAGYLNDIFGLGANAYTIGILENTVNLDAIKAQFDSMNVP